MKKMITLSLSLMIILSLAACGGKKGDKDPAGSSPDVSQQQGDTGGLTQKELEDADKALELLEAMIPEGWDENNYGAYIYKVWDETFLPDCFPSPIDGVEVDQTFFKDYNHDTLNGSYDVGPLSYESKEDYREYGVRFYATEAQLEEFTAALEAKGFTGGQKGDREGDWWEFYYYNNDGWFMYLFFNTNDDQDGKFDGALTASATDSVFPLPASVDGIPLPLKGMTDYDYTKDYCIDDYSSGKYDNTDFNLASDPLPSELYTAWFHYYAATMQDARDYAQQLVKLGWELQNESEDGDTYYSMLLKDGVYAISNYYGYDVMMEVGFSDMAENLSY